MNTQHNLLTDPLLRIMLGAHSSKATLPEILESLGAKRDLVFPGLMAHQEHAWHVFLVQLAVIALSAQNETEPSQTSDWWESTLRKLTDGDEAWCLVVKDLSKPAFMQPPVPEGHLKGFKNRHTLASDIDVLVTSKNHDLKRGRLEHAEPEHWFYALMMLQTFEGFLGRGNYGICRMNGGFASRCVISWSPDSSASARFSRDTQVLLEQRASTSETYEQPLDGHSLLWALPWDGETPVGLKDCAPYFVEICRRVRMTDASVLLRTASKAARILQDAKGVVGDPWSPIVTKEHKTLNVPASGFGYRRMATLFGDDPLTLAVANRLHELDGPTPVLRASVLSRGQGTVEGLHVREVRVPKGAKLDLFNLDATPTEKLGERLKKQIEEVRTVQRKVLHPAVCVLMQGAPAKLNLKDDRSQRFLDAHDALVDQGFFEYLWASAADDADAHLTGWQGQLFEWAEQQFEKAVSSLPQSEARQPRTIATAARVLHGAARKNLKQWAAMKTKQQEKKRADAKAREGQTQPQETA